ncbi:MAG: cation diffusion facilitator family transporter [Pseudorhodoplanes sp.]|nr:cation diffusion facilitator family transporter [Pseudorhodoplanes sp.]
MQKEKEKVAIGSMAASAGLTIAKAVVGLMTGSLAILSEAAHSFIDFIATVMTYAAVRISGKPADEEHHYGHGKFESVAALAETALLFVLSGAVIWEAIKRLMGEDAAVEATLAAFAVMIASVIVDFFRARLLYRVAADTSSEALEADALHFSSDMWSSVAVLIGLAGVLAGLQWADAVAALVVAVFVLLAGWRLGRRTLDTLLDTAPAGLSERFSSVASLVPGVVAVENVRLRQVGKDIFAEIGVAVSRTLPIDRVASLKDAVIAAIRAEFPNAQTSVTIEPRALDNETVRDRVMVIARYRGLAVHHVTVHEFESRLSVSLDLEVDGQLPMGEAHEIADRLEEAVNAELGPGVEVETHIEPLQEDGATGRDASPGRVSEITAALSEIARGSHALREVHDVRVRETDEGEIVNFHCRVDAATTVHDTHEQVDDLERALRARWSSIRRVIGHAEP